MAFLVFFCLWLVFTTLLTSLQLVLRKVVAEAEQNYEIRLQQNLTTLFLFVPVRKLIRYWLLVLLFTASLLVIAQFHVLISVSIFTAIVFAPPLSYRWLVTRRAQQFIEQLPDVCLFIANTLRTGGTLPAALHFIREHMQGPVAQEFSLMLRQLRLGESVTDVFHGLLLRLPSDELERVVQAITLARESGGQLAVLMEKIARSLRTKAQLARRVRSLSAQGRMQGHVMTGLPVFLTAVLWFIEPQAMRSLLDSSIGWTLFAMMLVLLASGHYVIQRMIRVEIPL